MIVQVYSRKECGACERVKAGLNTYNIPFTEISVDDVGVDFIKENFPGKSMLPIVVINNKVYSGFAEVDVVLTEYGQNLGKELLTEG